MVRILILGSLLLAAAGGVAADEAPTAPSTPALAAIAPATTQSLDATKPRVKKASRQRRPVAT